MTKTAMGSIAEGWRQSVDSHAAPRTNIGEHRPSRGRPPNSAIAQVLDTQVLPGRALFLSACAPSAGSPIPDPAPAAAPPSAVASGSVGPCIDVGQLADMGDPAVNAISAISVALKASNLVDARSEAKTASHSIRSIADFVGLVRPDAEKQFRTAADTLDAAAAAFPGGLELLSQAQTELDQAFTLARTARCPE